MGKWQVQFINGWGLVCALTVGGCCPPCKQPQAAASKSPATESKLGPAVVLAPGRSEAGVTAECENYATVRVGALEYMNNMFGIEQAQGPYARGAQNLTLAAWPTASNRVSPQAIVAEVVLWLSASPGMQPTGTLAQTIHVPGGEYELWVNPNHGDRGDGRGWDLYYLRSRSVETKSGATIELAPLLAELVALGTVKSDLWVASLEFGNELRGGSGTLWVHDFDVTVKVR